MLICSFRCIDIRTRLNLNLSLWLATTTTTTTTTICYSSCSDFTTLRAKLYDITGNIV